MEEKRDPTVIMRKQSKIQEGETHNADDFGFPLVLRELHLLYFFEIGCLFVIYWLGVWWFDESASLSIH